MGNDREHFEEYRRQTAAKHTILEKYLFAYFNVLKTVNKNLVFIDGFAGRGSYDNPETGGREDGSPIRALRKIASLADIASRVSSFFIEKDKQLADQLKSAVDDFHRANSSIRRPQVACGEFAETMTQVLDEVEKKGQTLAPTFLFVDPCGVAGASFATIQRFMKQDSCEVLVFFNIDGIRRILGLPKLGPTMAELLGSEERARALEAAVKAAGSPQEKEELIVATYLQLLRQEVGARYVTAFRIEQEQRRITSHYLIHATRHPIGFRIMKDVMWGVGMTSEGRGGLALEQASVREGQLLFQPDWDRIKDGIRAELKGGAKKVEHFYRTLSERPDNRLCEKAYREALLELEADGVVRVLDKSGFGPAEKRRAKTLAKDYYVELVE